MPSVTLTIEGDASGATAAVQETTQALGGLGPAAASAGSALEATGRSGFVAAESTRGFKLEALVAIGAMSNLAQAANTLGGNMLGLGPGAQEAASALTNVAMAAAAGGSAAGPWGAAMAGGAAALKEIASASKEAGPSIQSVIGPINSMVEAAGGGAGSARTLAAAQKEAADAAAGSGSKYEQLVTALDRQRSAAADTGGGIAAMAAKVETSANAQSAYKAATDEAASATSNAATQAQQLAASQDQLASRLMATAGGLSTVADMAANAGMSLAQMSQNIGTQTVTAPPVMFPGRQFGGPVTAGRPYLVGERRPELFVPRQNGTIIPSVGSAGGGGGMSVIVNISGPVYGINDLDGHIKNVMRETAQAQTSLRGYFEERLMPFDPHKNLAHSTVAVAPVPASSGTALTLATGEGSNFPATALGAYNVIVWPNGEDPTLTNCEIIRVTTRAADAFSVIVRAQESSPARTIVVGDQVALVPTAKTFTDIEAAATAADAGNVVSIGGSSSAAMRAAIQAAIDTVNAAFVATGNPGVVRLPAGNFTLEDTTSILLKDGVMVVGQGKGITVLNAPVTAATYQMFTRAAPTDGAYGNLLGNATFGAASAASINATSTGYVAGDYFLITTTLGLINEVGRVDSIPDGTHIKPLEALHDTFTTAKGAQIKELGNMFTAAGIAGMSLRGAGATGASSYAIYMRSLGAGCRIDVRTENWLANGVIGTAVSIIVAYGCELSVEDEYSGTGPTLSAIEFNYVSASKITVWSHNANSVSSRWNSCHGNEVVLASGVGAGSRGIKLSASNCNRFAVASSDNGNFPAGGNSRGFTFADSSHHNVVGALHARDNIEIDLWYAGDGANTDSAFSDSFNMIGALSAGGQGTASNIYVGAACRGNHIGACTPGVTLDDQSEGLGLTIGNAMPIYVKAKEMDAWLAAGLGTPTYAPMAGVNQRYGCWDMAHTTGLIFNIQVPPNYAASQLRPVIYWTNRTAGSGNVVWRPNLAATPDGANIDSGTTLTPTTHSAVAAPVANVVKRTVISAGVQAVNGGDILTVILVRYVTGDTLGANNVGLIGVGLIPA